MKVKINISVRNPDWYWKDDDFQKEWILINGDKEAKYLPSVTFGLEKNVIEHNKPEDDQYTFQFTIADEFDSGKPFIHEVTLKGLDITQFRHTEGSTPVIISKSILHNMMANQNNGQGTSYWYYFIHQDAQYVEVSQNIWLSKEHFDELLNLIPNFSIKNINNLY